MRERGMFRLCAISSRNRASSFTAAMNLPDCPRVLIRCHASSGRVM